MIYRLKTLARLVMMALITIGVISLAYAAGFKSQYLAASEARHQRDIQALIEASAAPLDSRSPREFAVFWEAMAIVQREFYGPAPTDADILYGAIRGAVRTLDDPHTVFVDPIEARRFEEDLNGSFEGIGATIEKRNDLIMIVAPLPDTPADRAGLRAGDTILAVDGESVQGVDLWEAILKIRGPRGENVTLTILRDSRPAPFEVVIRRDRIDIPTVSTRTITQDDMTIGYIKLYSFNHNVAQPFRQDLRQLMRESPQGVILDLRDNPGGLLHVAVQIASEFIADGLILTERGKDDRRNHPAIEGGVLAGLDAPPVVVLVNRGSASASEIVAGAIQDHQRGVLIGETTFGKGSVQVSRDLRDGSNLRVSIARWFTPQGRQIHGLGLEPDIVVAQTDAEIEAGIDAQLERAVQYLIEFR